MDFYDVIRKRRSIRNYQPTPIPQEALDRISEAVQLAPTACNFQPFKLLFIESAPVKKIVCDCYPRAWLAEAPLIVVALGDRETAWKRFNGTSAHTIDVSIAMEHLVLAATAENLGTCWICAFDQQQLHEKLGLEARWDVVALTPLGFPKNTPDPKVRKSIEELIQKQ